MDSKISCCLMRKFFWRWIAVKDNLTKQPVINRDKTMMILWDNYMKYKEIFENIN